MDFAFSPEQELLRASAREFLADRFPVERVAALADSDAGWDPASWAELTELGWLGLSVGEEAGGSDSGFLDEAVLLEETGYALYPGPFFSTVALALPALEAGYREHPEPLAAVLAGTRTASLGWEELGGPRRLDDADGVQTAATWTAGSWHLTGRLVHVPDLTVVDDVVVPARTEEGVALFAVDVATHRGAVIARSTTDRTRRLGDLHLSGTPADLLVAPGDAEPVLALTRLRAGAAAACEAVGVGQRALDLTAGYVTQRQQFGRVIGTYQAVSHRAANIYVAVQLARSLAYWAAWCVEQADPQARQACAAAKSAAAEAAVFACENAIQAHGGMGFTWEHPLHRLYKRAQWLDAYDGFGPAHRAEIAAALLDPDPA